MPFDYSDLWEILEEKEMFKKDLGLQTGISLVIIAKLGKNQAISMSGLAKICRVLQCDIGDIVS